jgi:pimeloyl-ACP methyl ester carboxylesterase
MIKFFTNFSKKILKLKDKNFITTDGYELSYSDNEEYNKPVLFFIHGHIFARYTFFPLAFMFRKGYRLILVDIPGYTDSSCFADGDYTFLNQAKRFKELIDHLALEKVNLISTSLGGAIAIVLNSICTNINTNTLLSPFGMPLYTKELPGILEYFLTTGKAAFVIDKPYDIKKMKKLFYLGSNIPEFLQPMPLHNEIKSLIAHKADAVNKLNKDVLYDHSSLVSVFKEHPKYSALAKEYNLILDNPPEGYNLAYEFTSKYTKNKDIKIDPIGDSYKPLISHLEKIENKVLVIWGKTDEIIHYKTMETMKPHIKNGIFKLYNSGSHVLFVLNPFGVSKNIKAILKDSL